MATPQENSVTDARLKELEQAALSEIQAAGNIEVLEQVKTKYLGRNGSLTALLRAVSSLSAEERPRIGRLANETKTVLEASVKDRRAVLAQAKSDSAAPALDITLPGRRAPLGHIHPLTRTTREICDIFASLGFEVATGPQVELDYYNFEALNFPKDHPARDMQSTFFIADGVLLRTHTSPVQVRVMEKRKPPIKIIAPGTVFRCDSDVTHSPMFNQVEGFLVGEKVSFSDLKGVLTVFVHRMFTPDTRLRFRPSFFPFTEPSAEIDISCIICGGGGCRVCKNSGWLEILGSGMIDPEVFRAVGYDPEKVVGFAFGMGVERIAMLKYRIDDIRLFYENDLRFLQQF